ncbi:E3 ubiquitin-protein ligase RNFT1 isoform X1 [Anopheles gambiae]|uniref:E3 ubiquitin-protein ligase RNFT1 isoform X1 n=1 Tax=Anopheles gambiae TaxID=7165 RepID=UPI001AADDD19|nr:E3 ubiquitin-protein ligase RNFT1 isoform X1 [Anopheles gambiae]XP_061496915.1 E3 ubiquitin-protein ligase RNFT1 isoform X1 [Anopheles gambiae]
MSEKAILEVNTTHQTNNQLENSNRPVDDSVPSAEDTNVVASNSLSSVESSSPPTIISNDISSIVDETSTGNCTQQPPSGGTVPPTGSPLPASQIRTPVVERQTSIGSLDSTSMSIGAGSGSGGGPSGFRNSLSNGRMFSRLMSVERGRSNNHGTTSRRGSNFSNVMLNDFMALLQQARHPGSLFSGERTGLFLNSERSHGTGTSTPPMMSNSIGSIGNGNSNIATSDVVIDVDDGTGTIGGGSSRSSHNELYPMSNSSSTANTSIRPFLWIQSGDENAPPSGSLIGGRSPLMPNFNYSHHHHHFNNHQPLALHHQQSAAGLSAASVSMASQSSISIGGGEGIPSMGSDGTNGAVLTPTAGNAPTIGAGGATRSNSISSNHQNEEATVHEALNQLPETRALIETLARYMPLLLILLAKLCYDHLDGIMHFLLLLMTFYHANWVVRQEISKQKQRRVMVLLRELIIIILALLIFGFVIEWKSICLVILFMSDNLQPESLKGLLFAVCITDLILKLITIVIKIIVTLMPPRVVDYKSRGKVYLMIESLSQLYRAAAPIQPWLIFLFESYSGSEKMVGVILSAVYIVAKSTDLLDRVKFCRRSFVKLLQKTSYGTVPTKEQLQACGGQCSICHDNFNSPVLLECNHIFCELCVGTWFDREQTCPLCRAKIVDDPSYRDGATTFFLQLY